MPDEFHSFPTNLPMILVLPATVRHGKIVGVSGKEKALTPSKRFRNLAFAFFAVAMIGWFSLDARAEVWSCDPLYGGFYRECETAYANGGSECTDDTDDPVEYWCGEFQQGANGHVYDTCVAFCGYGNVVDYDCDTQDSYTYGCNGPHTHRASHIQIWCRCSEVE